MMTDAEEATALAFAQALAARDYGRAYEMLSSRRRAAGTAQSLGQSFERMVPLDWGPIEPIEIVEPLSDPWPFTYISLGGNVYSEAIIVHSFVVEDGSPRVDEFEFGRP